MPQTCPSKTILLTLHLTLLLSAHAVVAQTQQLPPLPPDSPLLHDRVLRVSADNFQIVAPAMDWHWSSLPPSLLVVPGLRGFLCRTSSGDRKFGILVLDTNEPIDRFAHRFFIGFRQAARKQNIEASGASFSPADVPHPGSRLIEFTVAGLTSSRLLFFGYATKLGRKAYLLFCLSRDPNEPAGFRDFVLSFQALEKPLELSLFQSLVITSLLVWFVCSCVNYLVGRPLLDSGMLIGGLSTLGLLLFLGSFLNAAAKGRIDGEAAGGTVFPLVLFVAVGVFMSVRHQREKRVFALRKTGVIPSLKNTDLAQITRLRQKRSLFYPVAAVVGWNLLLIFVRGEFLIEPFSSCLIWFVINRKTRKGELVILWLRRFHRQHSGVQLARRTVSRACEGLGVPVTLQDTSVSVSTSAAVLRGALALPLAAVVSILVVMPLVTLGNRASPPTFPPLAISGGVLAIAFVGVLIYRRLGIITIRSRNIEKVVVRITRRIRKRRGLLGSLRVLRCDTSSWRTAVTSCLENADFAVVDVSEASENVEWELRSAIEILGTSRVTIMNDFSLMDISTLCDKEDLSLAPDVPTIRYVGDVRLTGRSATVYESHLATMILESWSRSPDGRPQCDEGTVSHCDDTME